MKRLGAIALCLLLGCAEPALETHRQPIVNGEETSGFPTVGVLTRQTPGGGNSGTYCSATLVAPQWVLTAGHCLDAPNGVDAHPFTLTFFLGDQLSLPVTPSEAGPEGHHLADARVLHPEYNPLFYFNDVALLHLTEPVPGAAPYPLRGEPITSEMLGTPVTFVGFGKLGQNMGGTGTKRVATMPLSEIQGNYFVTDYQGSGVCEGDSGGAAFLPSEDGLELAGVVSGLVGGTPDICQSDASSSRVDYYRDWIVSHIEGPGPDCHDHPDMCLCPAGCNDSGSCDLAACEVTSCLAHGACLADCDGGFVCTIACHRRAADGIAEAWDLLADCGSDCQDDADCLESTCPEEFAACAESAAELACGKVLACLESCSGPSCEADCHARGDGTALALLTALDQCAGTDCDVLLDLCFATDTCTNDEDCAADQSCLFPLAEPAVGECGCRDDDEDGWCAADECDDGNDLVNPGIGELCGDGVDNDCNGDIDEGCTPPAEPDTADITSEPETGGQPEVTSKADAGDVQPEPNKPGGGGGCSAVPASSPWWAGLLFLLLVLFQTLRWRCQP